MTKFIKLFGLLALVLLSSCSSDKGSAVDRERFPDDQGIVTSVSLSPDKIQLDNKRTYPISRQVESFSTYNGKLRPLLGWKDRYVELGLDKTHEVIWIAGIGNVNQAVKPYQVYYTNGTLKRVDKGMLIFTDGTVFKLGDGVSPPKPGSKYVVTLNAETHLV
ncbi:MAG: hypothetical protein LC723_06325, partial [Actinobacteria bacterium]|nr:hypothetical protein [Actinomycetota bacterium]